MARYLVLDWDQHQLHVLAAATKHRRCQIERLASWDLENGADPAAVGRFLAERLKSEQIKAAPVLACIGRDSIIIRDIRFPAVPLQDEPAVVRFQAVKELTNPADEVVIDYLRQGEAGPGGEQRALVMIVRRELLAGYQQICQTAGLKLAAVTPRAVGVAICLNQVASATPGTPDGALAVVSQTAHWAEFCVVRHGVPRFARALAAPGRAGDTALLGELRRNLAVFASQSGGQPVQALYLAGGGGPSGLRDRLQEALAIPVHDLDPCAGLPLASPATGAAGAFAGMVGLIRALASGSPLPVDFLHAKEPKPPRDPNQKRLIVAAAVAAVCLLLGVYYCYTQLDARDLELQNLTRRKLELDGQLVPIGEDAKRLQVMGDWTSDVVVWLDELYNLTEVFPDTATIRLTHLTADPMPRSGKKKYVARMVLKGITNTDPHPLGNLFGALVGDGHYRVEYPSPSRNMGLDRFDFIQQFSMRLDVEPRPPAGKAGQRSPGPVDHHRGHEKDEPAIGRDDF